jgi:hypothetical protein
MCCCLEEYLRDFYTRVMTEAVSARLTLKHRASQLLPHSPHPIQTSPPTMKTDDDILDDIIKDGSVEMYQPPPSHRVNVLPANQLLPATSGRTCSNGCYRASMPYVSAIRRHCIRDADSGECAQLISMPDRT